MKLFFLKKTCQLLPNRAKTVFAFVSPPNQTKPSSVFMLIYNKSANIPKRSITTPKEIKNIIRITLPAVCLV